MKTYWAVAVEADSSAPVNWYFTLEAAKQLFAEACGDWPADDINMWAFEMPNDATKDEITARADDQMWELDYTAIEKRPA